MLNWAGDWVTANCVTNWLRECCEWVWTQITIETIVSSVWLLNFVSNWVRERRYWTSCKLSKITKVPTLLLSPTSTTGHISWSYFYNIDQRFDGDCENISTIIPLTFQLHHSPRTENHHNNSPALNKAHIVWYLE